MPEKDIFGFDDNSAQPTPLQAEICYASNLFLLPFHSNTKLPCASSYESATHIIIIVWYVPSFPPSFRQGIDKYNCVENEIMGIEGRMVSKGREKFEVEYGRATVIDGLWLHCLWDPAMHQFLLFHANQCIEILIGQTFGSTSHTTWETIDDGGL